MSVSIIVATVLFCFYLFQYISEKEKAEKEEEQFFQELMNNNDKTKMDMDKKDMNESNNLNEATSLLVLTTLRNIGCNLEKVEYGLSDVITFTYQGQTFFIVCNGGSHYITVKNSCWHQISIYSDVEEKTKMYRIINLSNERTNCTMFYTIDKEEAMISVHCRKQILFNKEIQQLNSYLRRALGDIFVAQRIFREQMGKCKVTDRI